MGSIVEDGLNVLKTFIGMYGKRRWRDGATLSSEAWLLEIMYGEYSRKVFY
jgi:hypothetical protein